MQKWLRPIFKICITTSYKTYDNLSLFFLIIITWIKNNIFIVHDIKKIKYKLYCLQ